MFVSLFVLCSMSSGFGARSFQSPVLGESASMYYHSQAQSKELSENGEMDDPRFYQELLVWPNFYALVAIFTYLICN